MERILDRINSPRDLKNIPLEKLPVLADEIRKEIVETVSKNGGHLASSLGAVELAISLHYCFDMPRDKIIWDVGHQAYAHKLLTGRVKAFRTLRQLGGISGFPSSDESEYDIFTCGHSATSISQALGLACARDIKGEKCKTIAVIGDASLASGMALEALNHAGHLGKDLVVVLNDNELSISKSVGALSKYLNRIMINPIYNKVRRRMQILVKHIPLFGFKAFRAARKLEESLKNLLVPGILFEGFGFRYFGPIDGHDVNSLISTFKSIASFKEPIIIHAITKKGKGYKFAEENPYAFHGTSNFEITTGKPAENRETATFTDVFSRKIVDIARRDERIVAVTAAMPDGTGLSKFSSEFPNRFYDVGIAEEHAVSFSGGLAKSGLKPIIAIYSTFLQRGYDQIIHDISLQRLPVIFCIDRAGLVGEDGPTHHGAFDIAYLRHIPNLIVMAPRDGLELEAMLDFAVTIQKPVAIRYPKGSAASHISGASFHKVELGKSEILREGKDLAILAAGNMVSVALEAAGSLSDAGIETTVVNARFLKPLDKKMIENITSRVKRLVTLEEGVATGGFGSAVLEFLQLEKIGGIKVERIGLPDHFITYGKREELFKEYHMTADEICENIKKEFFEK
ncbi:MAG: 1-deoxy-D-xylulose-5-phosphate synthase [Candidatus Omnitrophica bacterium]|nr:1-deoxy-D-xylulose-5-phosphate synthase [Candidatus Omnitrophota bacterium]